MRFPSSSEQTYCVFYKKDGVYMSAYFSDPDKASSFAKEHDAVAFYRDTAMCREEWFRKIVNVGVFLGSLFVLSVIGWGWIDCLIGAGLI